MKPGSFSVEVIVPNSDSEMSTVRMCTNELPARIARICGIDITGQLLALQGFVPITIRRKLAMLQSDMPPVTEDEASCVINAELQNWGTPG